MSKFAIKFAVRVDDPEVTWRPEDIDLHVDDWRAHPWRCGGCTSRVAPVRGHTLRTGDWRDSHFALRRLSGRDRAEHSDDCDFHVVRALREELRDVRGVRGARKADRFEVVIDMSRLPIEDAAVPPPDPLPPQEVPGASDGRRQRVVGPRRRPTLLNDVTTVITLLHRYYDDPSAAERFSAICYLPLTGRQREPRTVEVPWLQFYFSPDRHGDLLDRVLRGVGCSYPLAVSGQIVFDRYSADRLQRYLYLALKDEPREINERLVLRGPTEQFTPYAVGQAIVTLSRWKRWSPRVQPGRRQTVYCTSWPDHPSQMQRLDDPGILDERRDTESDPDDCRR